MSNGTVMGRAGSASVAMAAHALSKPVLICCESYKFHERVQLDSITHNEVSTRAYACACAFYVCGGEQRGEAPFLFSCLFCSPALQL
jgi:translation initiation factor 2B subunit (eIF-2B alpha/beta/delta family)